ncbi:hypothetical protein [Thermococcus sp. 21S9]|uniref:hypothetical protein n=1 Tax=Thermococcus sp. 21S9 TaxID=1638223 RepID=UPI00143B1422|nr:hypothetical protein [Thermococcus sp. 21S9]NJE55222.1 hypothetical protein [Thermococcus sp. 21S9]
MRNRKATMVVLLIMAIIVIGYHGTVHNNKQNEYSCPELRFQDNITEKALDYAQSYHPGWQWSIATLCIWPNNTATVLVYGNYTINCEGLTCSRKRGLLYAVNLNLTNLELVSFKKVPSNAYDELIHRCEELRNETEKRILAYCRSHLARKCMILTSCQWPNETTTFLLHVNYTTVCKGYNCEAENGTFYEVTFDPSWKVLSVRKVSDGHFELRTRCDLAWLSLWRNEVRG